MRIFKRHRPVGSRARVLSIEVLCGFLLATGLVACGTSTGGSSDGTTPAASDSHIGSAAKLVSDSLKSKTINVAVLNDYPPGGFLKDGTLVGYAPDLMKAIAADAGLNVNLQVATFDSMIPGLQGRRWDLAIPPFQVTDQPNDQVSVERRKILDFIAIHRTGTVFIVRSGSGTNVNQASDLCGRTVAVIQGGLQVKQLEEVSKQCQQDGKAAIVTQTFGSNNDAALAVVSSRVEILVTGASSLSDIVNNSNGKLEGEAFTFSPNFGAIGFPEGSELEPIILQAIKDLMANGTYKEIYDKYNVSNLAMSAPVLIQ